MFSEPGKRKNVYIAWKGFGVTIQILENIKAVSRIVYNAE